MLRCRSLLLIPSLPFLAQQFLFPLQLEAFKLLLSSIGRFICLLGLSVAVVLACPAGSIEFPPRSFSVAYATLQTLATFPQAWFPCRFFICNVFTRANAKATSAPALQRGSCFVSLGSFGAEDLVIGQCVRPLLPCYLRPFGAAAATLAAVRLGARLPPAFSGAPAR